MIKSLLLSLVLFVFSYVSYSQDGADIAKKRLNSKVYNEWKNISNQQVSDNGQWISYEINPQKGDGYLYLYNTETMTLDSIARGVNASFSPASDFLVFQIEIQYDTLRNLKLKKTPKKKLPKDSLGIWIFESDSIIKIANAVKYEITQRNNAWITYVDKSKKKAAPKAEAKKSWLFFKKKTAEKPKKKIKQEGENIVLYEPINNTRIMFDKADEYSFNYDGTALFVLTVSKLDSSEKSVLQKIDLSNQDKKNIFKQTGTATKLSLSRDGNQLAFIFAQDTAKKNKIYDLYYWSQNDSSASLIVDTLSQNMVKKWSPSVYYKPWFSKDGNKLYFGTAPKPIQEPKDTLLAEEKYSVDVWNYMDGLLQPQQKKQARRERNRTYLAIWDTQAKSMQQLGGINLRTVRPANSGEAHFALGIEGKRYEKEQTWDGWYSDYYAVNVHDGSREMVLEHYQSRVSISPNGSYILYFKNKDKNWYAYDIEARKHTNLTKDLSVNFYNELHDMPNEPRSYSVAGWYKNDKYIVVNDRYDLWRLDPTGKSAPLNLTMAYGRENKIRFSAMTLNYEDNEYFNDENPHYLRAFSEKDKSAGYYRIDLQANEQPEKLIHQPYSFYFPLKAKNSNTVVFRKSSFTKYPDLYLTDINFKKTVKVSNTNPQQSEYLWGNVELVNWQAFDGQQLEGLLYKPEDFDSTLRYPVIVYFYERYSDDLHRHYIPKPSHSTINFTEYLSNGYIVFVPDITYKIGHPAKSAYNAIVSGTEFLKKHEWIDSAHIGIQGQSWGGYQVAMLVTMTDIYACAEAGAPVSNMISAYGGIRWSSGMNRAFQYEKTQSRIGVTIWDSLDLYIENSPIFGAPKVNTPLLIMHNDKDGAVPWYQGIEYFTALRRLDKKVWMLTYNGDGHNLMKWPNRVDLSIRMMQFFDHYLKGMPMPIWMSEGLPAHKKGKTDAYEYEPTIINLQYRL